MQRIMALSLLWLCTFSAWAMDFPQTRMKQRFAAAGINIQKSIPVSLEDNATIGRRQRPANIGALVSIDSECTPVGDMPNESELPRTYRYERKDDIQEQIEVKIIKHENRDTTGLLQNEIDDINRCGKDDNWGYTTAWQESKLRPKLSKCIKDSCMVHLYRGKMPATLAKIICAAGPKVDVIYRSIVTVSPDEKSLQQAKNQLNKNMESRVLLTGKFLDSK
jgi:hypothetical protein